MTISRIKFLRHIYDLKNNTNIIICKQPVPIYVFQNLATLITADSEPIIV